MCCAPNNLTDGAFQSSEVFPKAIFTCLSGAGSVLGLTGLKHLGPTLWLLLKRTNWTTKPTKSNSGIVTESNTKFVPIIMLHLNAELSQLANTKSDMLGYACWSFNKITITQNNPFRYRSSNQQHSTQTLWPPTGAACLCHRGHRNSPFLTGGDRSGTYQLLNRKY